MRTSTAATVSAPTAAAPRTRSGRSSAAGTPGTTSRRATWRSPIPSAAISSTCPRGRAEAGSTPLQPESVPERRRRGDAPKSPHPARDVDDRAGVERELEEHVRHAQEEERHQPGAIVVGVEGNGGEIDDADRDHPPAAD